jgi:hypothetical protein
MDGWAVWYGQAGCILWLVKMCVKGCMEWVGAVMVHVMGMHSNGRNVLITGRPAWIGVVRMGGACGMDLWMCYG